MRLGLGFRMPITMKIYRVFWKWMVVILAQYVYLMPRNCTFKKMVNFVVFLIPTHTQT